MAILFNPIIHGLHGKLGPFVFCMRGEKQIVKRCPLHSKPPTFYQKKITEKFKAAASYAKAILKNADIKKQYGQKAKNGQSAFNVAIADYFNAPEVKLINVHYYTGQPGSHLYIHAVDDFKVTAVYISIIDPAGKLVEEGQAVYDAKNSDWLFPVTQYNPPVKGTTIIATAFDMPGNFGTMQVVLE